MPVWFPSASSSLRNKLKPHLDAAFEALDWDAKVPGYLGLPDTEPAEELAVCLDDGIHFNPTFVREVEGIGLRAVCFEEVGHAFLGSLGVPLHDNALAVLIQEAWATWFAYSRMAGEGRPLDTVLKTTDIPPDPNDEQLPMVYWMVGTQAGAAIAGSDLARARGALVSQAENGRVGKTLRELAAAYSSPSCHQTLTRPTSQNGLRTSTRGLRYMP